MHGPEGVSEGEDAPPRRLSNDSRVLVLVLVLVDIFVGVGA